MNKKVITTVLIGDQKFVIVYHMERYCAVNTKYLDENGRLKKTLNGLQLHARSTLQECIDEVRMSVEVQQMTDKGMTIEEALREYHKDKDFWDAMSEILTAETDPAYD